MHTDDILPDEILDKHLGGGSPQPAAESGPPSPSGADEDTDESTFDDEHEDTELDEAGDDELDDKLEEGEDDLDDEGLDDDEDDLDDDDDLDPEDDEDDDAGSTKKRGTRKSDKQADFLENVTAEERERIEQDPGLRKLHRKMQADYTRKTQAIARDRKRVAQFDQFMEHVRTPEGSVQFLRDIVLADPNIAAAAFEQIATGDGAKDFLIEVGLALPEVFEEAWDRVQDLQHDDEERERHIEKRNREREDAEWERRRAARAREQFEERLKEIESYAEKLAERAGLEPEDTGEVHDEIMAAMRAKRQAGEGYDLSNAEIKAIVLRVRKDIRAREERIRKRLERRGLKEARERTKALARNAQRGRVAPRTSSSTASRAGKPKLTGDLDRDLDNFIDARLSKRI